MKTIGNILWLILGGFFGAIEAFLEGVLLCITIIFIPVGLQMFKIPSGFKTVINVIWCITGGIIHFLVYGLVGVIFCITIIGIPFGKQYFKLARFILTPLGHDFQ